MLEGNYAVSCLLSLASLFLGACSVHIAPFGVPQRQPFSEWPSHQQSVSMLTRYQTRGALACLSNEKKVYVRFNWQQISADRYRLILTNSFGITEMKLNVQPGLAQFVNKQGKCYVNADPEILLYDIMGIYIPIKHLRKWILGLPGNTTDFTLDFRGYLRQLNYSHNGRRWTVFYKSYHEDTVPALPSILELRQGDSSIQLKMDSWSL